MTRKKIYIALIHMFCFWLWMHLQQVIPYMLKVHFDGYYIQHTDGSPVTIFEYIKLMYRRNNLYHLVTMVLLYIPLVELSYWLVVRRSSLAKAALASIVLGLFIALLGIFPFNKDAFLNFPLVPVYSMLSYSAYAMIYGQIRKSLYERRHRLELQMQRAENELNALKAQLNPHFFFNSLNYLYGTALKENARQTAGAIGLLSDMMRYTVQGMQKNFVPLREDLDFINNFITLQRERLPLQTSIRIESNITNDTNGLQIAPLLLLPFIENAFKYGISIDHESFVKVDIRVTYTELSMQVYNLIIHEHHEVKGNNTGINNTRKRLDLMYPGKYSLQCNETEKDYTVSLHLALN
ncbi:MAG: histidine kinase [Bacteroidota bacterium]